MDIDLNRVIDAVMTATPPTLVALAAWRSSKKNNRVANATRIGVGNVGTRVGEVHDIVNGQREKMAGETSSLREEVKALREEIGGLKQEVIQLKKQVLGGSH